MNAPPAAPPRDAAALAPAQHKAALWADPGLRVYALLMGTRLPGLPALLAQAPSLDYHCLWPGALSPERQARAPYLALLEPTAAFTDWVLFEAAAGFGEWGVLVRSALGSIDMRSHARGLCEAVTASGLALELDWMDPEVLRALLPLAAPDQLQAIFGPLAEIVAPTPQRWVHHRVALGRLDSRGVEMMAAPVTA